MNPFMLFARGQIWALVLDEIVVVSLKRDQTWLRFRSAEASGRFPRSGEEAELTILLGEFAKRKRSQLQAQAIRPTPAHALSAEERQRILEVANEPRFAELPPARIVPMLADGMAYCVCNTPPTSAAFQGRPQIFEQKVLKGACMCHEYGIYNGPQPGPVPPGMDPRDHFDKFHGPVLATYNGTVAEY